MSEVLNNILNRKSVRSFTDEPLKKEELDLILKAGIHAPSAMNLQQWQFTVLTDKAKIQRLAGVVREQLNRLADYDFYDPVALVLVSDPRDNVNAVADCAVALENMFLMATDLGIGSCWINQLRGICDEPEIRKALDELSVPANHLVWGMAALGYPSGDSANKTRDEAVIKYV